MLSSAISPANGCSFATWKDPIPIWVAFQSLRRPASGPEEGNELFFSIFFGRTDRFRVFDGNHTFSNNKLADYYKLEGKFDESFKKVSLSGEKRLQRGGILSHASILTVTSNPTRPRRSSEADGFWIICWGLRPKSLRLEYLNWRRLHRERPCNDSS